MTCRYCGASLAGPVHAMTLEEELRLAELERSQQEPYVELPLSAYGIEEE